jgi:glycolate oxidase iron-sulfur subunit
VTDKPHMPTEEQYLNCIRCGLCLAVCPTYREDLSEVSSPRGRVALARKGLEGNLQITPGLMDRMYACFDCLACNEICPVGIRPADLAIAMRTFMEEVSPAGWKKLVFDDIFSNPDRLDFWMQFIRSFDRLGMRSLARGLGQHGLLPGILVDAEAMLPGMSKRPLRKFIPEVTNPYGESRHRIGFFLGCLQNQFFGDESAASVRVLARNGCTVITPSQSVCCGMPALGYGRLEQVKKQARQNIALFDRYEVEHIITDCATCGSTLKDYGKFLADDPEWAGRASAFSQKVRDISEFLVSIPLEKPRGRIEKCVTYHDPCHLRRAQNVWREPRQLLTLIDGLEFVELPEADWCCGLAGTQLLTHHETSVKVLKRKTDNLSKTHAEAVLSGCPACQMQLTAGMKRAGLNMQVTHPVTLLDKAYGNDKKG